MKHLKFVLVLMLVQFSSILVAQDLIILHTNDTHSHIDPVRSGENAGLGGVIERAAFVDSVRQAYGRNRVLLFDAGDFSQGTSYFTLMRGSVETRVMNAMRYDIACLGNHEFDNGLEELADRLSKMKFPVVCANYEFTDRRMEKLVKPYHIFRRNGFKIGVIGLLTDLTVVVDREIADKMKYLDPAATADRYARFLKEEKGCDIVICLTHLGYENEGFTDRELAVSVSNVDLVIGGHSHTFLDRAESETGADGREVKIVTDGCWGIYVGQVALTFGRTVPRQSF